MDWALGEEPSAPQAPTADEGGESGAEAAWSAAPSLITTYILARDDKAEFISGPEGGLLTGVAWGLHLEILRWRCLHSLLLAAPVVYLCDGVSFTFYATVVHVLATVYHSLYATVAYL